VDGEDKYYRLRELKRGLADVVVKVIDTHFASWLLKGGYRQGRFFYSTCCHQHQGERRCKGEEGG